MNFKDFRTELSIYRPEEIVFVGLGNLYRGDDSAGLVFLDKLKTRAEFMDSNFIYAQTNPENHLNEILSFHTSAVIFIDAFMPGNEKDCITWLNEEQIDKIGISTHSFSLSLIARYLRLNKQVAIRFLGISIKSNKFGDTISHSTLEFIDGFFLNK
ncbi:MAG: hydrogenase maturation protease [Ignavibacteriales bacterium]